MSSVIAIAPPDWLEIPNANQLLDNYGDRISAMGFLVQGEWGNFNSVVDMHLPPDTATAEAYMLGDSFFVRLMSTL